MALGGCVFVVQDLVCGYPPVRVVGPVSAAASRGTFCCLLGANGTGKSTLIRTLAGMRKAMAGEVRLGGVELSSLPSRELARRIAVVLTDRAVAGGLRGADVVRLGRHPHSSWLGRLSSEDEAAVAWAVEDAGAADLMGKPLDEMSDGQRQRVMIARALAQASEVLILDEATAFLDLPRRIALMDLLRDVAHRRGRLVILSTHDLDLALRYADAVWLLDACGTLHVGVPEDVALSGKLGAAFATEGFEFDVARGELRPRRTAAAATVAVRGSGEDAIWVRRAVERLGYAVGDASGAARASIEVDGGVYRLFTPGTVRECRSVGELVRELGAADA